MGGKQLVCRTTTPGIHSARGGNAERDRGGGVKTTIPSGHREGARPPISSGERAGTSLASRLRPRRWRCCPRSTKRGGREGEGKPGRPPVAASVSLGPASPAPCPPRSMAAMGGGRSWAAEGEELPGPGVGLGRRQWGVRWALGVSEERTAALWGKGVAGNGTCWVLAIGLGFPLLCFWERLQ